jgi:hypothetical protein
MWQKCISALILILVNASAFSVAQQNAEIIDSTFQWHTLKNDSIALSGIVESFSKHNLQLDLAYGVVSKPVKADSLKKITKRRLKQNQKPYSNFEGKIIRQIAIETLDPFGNSIADTIHLPQTFISRIGNKLHLKTRDQTIRNLLLFQESTPFDSLLVKETERLVRSQQYITEVLFSFITPSHTSDSVDVNIRVLDSWSIIPYGSVSSNHIMVEIVDRNFLGLGHNSSNSYTLYCNPEKYAYNIYYHVPNIGNTFINSTILLETNQFGHTTKSFAVDRPFFSPLAKWGAGIGVTDQYRRDFKYASDSVIIQHDVIFKTLDLWAGNAVNIFKRNNKYDRSTNFVSSVRYFRLQYSKKPDSIIDTIHQFSNENFFLASLGISTRRYMQDKYIFEFGLIEDVPVGKMFSLTAGYQKREHINRLYLGARVSMGKYYRWGYLSSNFEYGFFVASSHLEQAVVNAGVNYFSNLYEIGKWKFRNFVKPQVTIGISQFSYDSLTLNKGYGMDGFNSPTLSGNSRMILTLQVQSYAPWNILGYRFGPFFNYSFGILGDKKTGFRGSKGFSHFGLGVLIKNDKLIISTFQISISYYPSIPGTGFDVFKLNTLKSSDFGFRDFDTGKPSVVLYQ